MTPIPFVVRATDGNKPHIEKTSKAASNGSTSPGSQSESRAAQRCMMAVHQNTAQQFVAGGDCNLGGD
jgi:hypothetical protein